MPTAFRIGRSIGRRWTSMTLSRGEVWVFLRRTNGFVAGGMTSHRQQWGGTQSGELLRRIGSTLGPARGKGDAPFRVGQKSPQSANRLFRLIDVNVMSRSFDDLDPHSGQLLLEEISSFASEDLTFGAPQDQRRAAHLGEIRRRFCRQVEPAGIESVAETAVRLRAHRFCRDVASESIFHMVGRRQELEALDCDLRRRVSPFEPQCQPAASA